MDVPHMPKAAPRWILTVLMFALAVFQPAHAQLSSLKKISDASKPKEQPAPEKTDDVRKRTVRHSVQRRNL